LAISQRWWKSIPFILALIVLAFLVLGAMLAIGYPHEGIRDFTPEGVISELDQYGINNGFQVGDVIVSVNNRPFKQALPFYYGLKPGQTAYLVINRGGEQLTFSVKLTNLPLDQYIVPLFVALIFWGVGVGVLSFKPDDYSSTLFFLFCQASALLLVSGMVSSIGPSWTSGLFNFMLWVIGPIAVHFHLHFPQNYPLRYQRAFLFVNYGIAILCGLPYLIWGTQAVKFSRWQSQLMISSRLFLTFNMLMVTRLLIHAYRKAGSPGVRSKIRIVVLGGVISLLPALMLTILPEFLSRKPNIPYAVGFLFLGILPLTYGYAIIRHRVIEIDKHVNRGATLIIVFSILGGFYAILYAVFAHILKNIQDYPLINILLVLILAGIFPWLHRGVQRLVDTAFYGGWYDYRSAVAQITQGLEQITDLHQLAEVISSRLVKILQLEDTCIFIRDLGGDFSVIEAIPPSEPSKASDYHFSVLPKNSLSYLLNIGAVERTNLRKALSEVRLSPEERQLLESDQVYLWVPVIGHDKVLGLIALGPKLGGDVYSGEDMDILRIISRQMGPLIENIHLVTRLREYASELEQRVEERTAELHAAKERVEAVLSSVGDGVIVTDLDGYILTVNHAYEEQSGFQGSEVIGRKIFTLIDGQEDLAQQVEIQAALKREYSWSGELVAHRKGGHQYDVQLTLAPIRNQVGEIMGYVGSQRDITQYKELERLKDQFILEVSHELRTPVTNMGLFAELLERGKPEKRAEYMEILKSEINQLMRMIEDILDLSRLEIGKYKKASFSPVNLNLLAEQVTSAHYPLAQEKGLELRFIACKDLPTVNGEQNQIARVITNLLTNAIRYTSTGYVRVKTYQLDGGVGLEVEDTGIGIDPEDFPHLFERFFRGKKVSQSKIMGTGLGLAIVKEIMELHDGTITLESEVGHGSTFQIWFPNNS
jgi:PAS domain S-box-containing protein